MKVDLKEEEIRFLVNMMGKVQVSLEACDGPQALLKKLKRKIAIL